MDVQVMRGATCWTDHKLVRAKLRIDLPKIQCHQKRPLPFSVHLLSSTAVRDEYRVQLDNELQGKPYDKMRTPQENWALVRSCIVSAAERGVGRGKKQQQEWVESAADELLPLRELKNKARKRRLADPTVAGRSTFRQ